MSVYKIRKLMEEGENDTTITKAELRFLLHHLRCQPQGLFGHKDIQCLSYLENGCVNAGDCWPFLTTRH